ncbi:MAG: hypothetical protein JXA24_07525 [Proteobacteria bacterium]|nr:hypothetical protein [Pseudomonadota bacterium]
MPIKNSRNEMSAGVIDRSVRVSIAQKRAEEMEADARLHFASDGATSPAPGASDGAMASDGAKSREGDVVRGEDDGNTYVFTSIFHPSSVADDAMRALAHSITNGLRRAASEFATSIAIALDDDSAERTGLSKIDVIDSVFKGVERYLQKARDEKEYPGISDIMLAAGKAMYLTYWMEITDIRRRLGAFEGGPIEAPVVRPPVFLPEFAEEEQSEAPVAALAMPSSSELAHEVPKHAVLSWLLKIGDALASGDGKRDISFYRNRGFDIGATPSEDLVVTFDAESGAIISADRGFHLPDPEDLESGQAAIRISTYDVHGMPAIKVTPDIVISDAPPSRTAFAVISAIQGRVPIAPKSEGEAVEMEDGSKIETLDPATGEKNARFMQKLLSSAEKESMTVEIPLYVKHEGQMRLATRLAATESGLDANALRETLTGMIMGHSEYDIAIERGGRFVGAKMHMSWANSPRKTSYDVGFAPDDASFARNVRFKYARGADGNEAHVPVAFEWEGPMGIAYESFKRWYDSPEFRALRSSMLLEEQAVELMYRSDDPARRIRAMFDHMGATRGLVRKLKSEAKAKDRESKSGFTSLIARVERTLNSERKLTPGQMVFGAYIEMLMRDVLGDAEVDRIVAGGGDNLPPKGGPGGGRALGGKSGGTPQPVSGLVSGTMPGIGDQPVKPPVAPLNCGVRTMLPIFIVPIK